MSRKDARENAFKMIFADITPQDERPWEEFFDETDSEIWVGKGVCDADKEYITALCEGVRGATSELDAGIEKYLRNWKIDRINRVCLAAMRLAIFEINNMEDVPYKVSASEAVELVKKYAGASEAKFVNGVLGEYIKNEISR